MNNECDYQYSICYEYYYSLLMRTRPSPTPRDLALRKNAIRTYLAKKKAGEIVAAQEAANREAMALRIQAWTRGWLDRMKVKKKWEEVLGMRAIIAHRWGAVTLQKWGRRYLARGVLAARRVELSVNGRLMRLAHRYFLAAGGDRPLR